MNKVKLLTILGMSGFILGACSTAETSSNAMETKNSQASEVAESEAVSSEEPGLEEIDQTIIAEFSKFGSEEEINWDKIHLNKRQYTEFVGSMTDGSKGAEGTDKESIEILSSKIVDETTIEMVISNGDSSELSGFSNQLFAALMDTYLRKMYLHSDYYDGSTQPTVIVKDNENNVIIESTNFMETEEKE